MEKYAHFLGAKNVRKYWKKQNKFTFFIYELLFAP